MEKIISILIIIALIVGIVALIGFNKKENKISGIEKIIDKGTLIMGVDDSYPPYTFLKENNELTGFDVDLAKEVTNRLGVKLEIQPISWSAKEQELNTNNIDCIWSGMDLTEEREKAFAMSNAYFQGGMVFVIKNSSNIKELADLKGKKIGVQGGSSDETFLEEANFYKELKEVVSYSDSLTGLLDLETGNIDAYLLSENYAKYYIKSNNKDLRVISSEFPICKIGIAFTKENSSLRDKINETLEEMRKDGTLEEISKKWFGNL